MNIRKELFGQFEGQDVNLYTLTNGNGMVVKIMNYGATITDVTIPGENDKAVSIVCGFDNFDSYFGEGYKANAPYFGCTVGRYSAQIKDSKFTLDGQEYQLNANCGANNLHGGTVGFDKKMWDAEEVKTDNAVGVKFSLLSQDMEEGYPGNVNVEVTMLLTRKNEIKIDYNATTDKATPLSLTNHSYWNLSGFKQNVEGFIAQVNTNTRLAGDETGACTGEILDLSGKADDLREGKKIGEVHEELGGFEHFYTFDNPNCDLNQTAEFTDPESGRKLEIYTTEPCMLLYTAKYMSDDLKRENGDQYGKYSAFACETHRYPNGPNIENSPMSITTPDKAFKSTTVFKLTF